jgi:AAA domain
MREEEETNKQLPMIIDDGFGVEEPTGNRFIVGGMIKYDKHAYTLNKTTPMPLGTVLVVLNIITAWVKWWDILRGSQELLTGVPGGGKSQIHCAFVAYVTTGTAWPDGCNGASPGNVIMLTAEDCLDQTIVPRLIAAGADRDRVFILKKIRKDNRERMFLLSEDIADLERMITKTGDVRLITIDPITAYMASSALADDVLYCSDTGSIGFYWTQGEGGQQPRQQVFNSLHFTIKVFADGHRTITATNGDTAGMAAPYFCHPEGSTTACELDGSNSLPWIFYKTSYTRASLGGGPPTGGKDRNIYVAYGTCAKF